MAAGRPRGPNDPSLMSSLETAVRKVHRPGPVRHIHLSGEEKAKRDDRFLVPLSQAPVSLAASSRSLTERTRSCATSMTSRDCLASPAAFLALMASPSMTMQ